ncbi:hypothetical protein [Pedobacter africanus]|uniref:Uncharacterized protein n=1 Tax=Pedobacter africanus TaxID=151894 RepID=A0A1W2CR32_9SPHI|nr:hypothetical protein [Pedobacter africanus]SMC87715.1 hypothetical protein SAMN04488524_3154 [Pedobacter africanus]
MGFIKHALIGIALYEAIKYVLKKGDCGLEPANDQVQRVSPVLQLRGEEVDIIAGARQTDQLDRMKENAAFGRSSAPGSQELAGQAGRTTFNTDDDLVAGTDPEAPLSAKISGSEDTWKNSLANDELRAPDS